MHRRPTPASAPRRRSGRSSCRPLQMPMSRSARRPGQQAAVMPTVRGKGSPRGSCRLSGTSACHPGPRSGAVPPSKPQYMSGGSIARSNASAPKPASGPASPPPPAEVRDAAVTSRLSPRLPLPLRHLRWSRPCQFRRSTVARRTNVLTPLDELHPVAKQAEHERTRKNLKAQGANCAWQHLRPASGPRDGGARHGV